VTRAEGGERLDRFLRKRIPWRSRTNLQSLIGAGLVLVNGVPARPATRVAPGNTVDTPVRDPRAAARASFDHPLSILIDDPDFIVVDKPPHLATHATGRHLRRNVIAALRAHAGDPTPTPVHRLDLETSGVLLCARSREAHRTLALQFERREVEKHYLAVVMGQVKADAGVLDPPLARHGGSHVRIRMHAGAPGGQAARTDFRILRRWRDFSLLQLVPHTGRQHQIRAQLEAFGHPVVGDKIYGPDERHFLDHLDGRLSIEARERLLLDRHALHAARLAFHHPRTGERMVAEAPLPEDLARFIDGLPGGA
jgi:23S rRNA pseudouridine1911/1915/1917 synthase